MNTQILQSVKILGIASAVPETVIYNENNTEFSADEVTKIVESTGVVARRIVRAGQCSSDLCYAAARKLLRDLDTDCSDIDIIVFVSQTPDYVLPATACALQNRLGLKKNIMAFDINLGCSGYTYGLIVLAKLLGSGLYKKALLLAGDTISKLVSPQDRSVAFLFGDAGSATLLEYNSSADALYFDLGTDGAGFDKLCVEAGACRLPYQLSLAKRELAEGSNQRAKTDLFMSGADIFAFTLREVPKTIQACLESAKLTKNEIDLFFFHQANLFMLNHLAKKMSLDNTKVPMSLQNYGNTSVASIPLTMCLERQKFLQDQTILLCGFGVGFSWATLIFKAQDLKILEPVVVGENE